MVEAPEPLADSPWADARWLVLAPHPDDETLGAGALIADASARGRFAGVVFLTDGAGSHPHDDAASRARLVAVRRQEGTAAVRLLTENDAALPVFLDWPDANPPQIDDPAFHRAVDRLATLCVQQAVSALAVTGGHEPHCDHAAAFALAQAVAARMPLTVFEYLVWADAPPPPPWRAVVTAALSPERRGRGLAAHVSQLSTGPGPGFRLPDHRRPCRWPTSSMRGFDHDPARSQSVGRLFRTDVSGRSRPVGAAEPTVEAAKFDDTIKALAGRRYDRGFEVGCAGGMLTRRIAPCAAGCWRSTSARPPCRARGRVAPIWPMSNSSG